MESQKGWPHCSPPLMLLHAVADRIGRQAEQRQWLATAQSQACFKQGWCCAHIGGASPGGDHIIAEAVQQTKDAIAGGRMVHI